ncbi:MAG: hypothetical protein IJ408_05580 [Clostridia bacterium]|nr:hypothetical protein [Clostridia bacterium]
MKKAVNLLMAVSVCLVALSALSYALTKLPQKKTGPRSYLAKASSYAPLVSTLALSLARTVTAVRACLKKLV